MKSISPIIVKELRPLLRSQKAFWLMLLALAVLGGVFVVLWSEMVRQISPSGVAATGRALFMMLSMALLGALGVISPLITATAITAEREAGTLDLLLSTGLSRSRILLGKLAASLGYQFLVVICMTPVLILPFMLGGVGMDEICISIVLILATTLTYGVLGLAVSCWMRRSIAALALTLTLVLTHSLLIPSVINEFGCVSPTESFIYIMQNVTSSPQFSDPDAPILVRFFLILINTEIMIHLLLQACLMVFCWLMALWGFKRRRGERTVKTTRLIDDPAELERRRKRWPYYLIDPLRRPQAIGDGANPLYIKEKRLGLMSRPVFFIRMCYVGGFLPILFIPALISDSVENMAAAWVAGLLIPLAPLALSQGSLALAREREQKTMDLLQAVPITSRAIINAKFKALMRTILLLTLSLVVPPLVFGVLVVTIGLTLSGSLNEIPIAEGLLFIRSLFFALMIAGFYAALGLWCSARARRGLNAIVGSCALAGALMLAPYLLEFLDRIAVRNAYIEIVGQHYTLANRLFLKYAGLPHQLVYLFNALVGPLISPMYCLSNNRVNESLAGFSIPDIGTISDQQVLFYQANLDWWTLLIHAAGVAFLAWLTLRLAARRLARR